MLALISISASGVAAMSTAGWTISVIAILVVAIIAWRTFGERSR